MRLILPASVTRVQILGFLILVLVLGPLPAAGAQTSQSIVAVVNDEVVSSFDIDQRLKILLLSSGLPDTAEQRGRLKQRVVQTLIAERLKTQEAERLGISLTAGEFGASIRSLEQANNLPEGGLSEFARRNGISPAAVEAQVRADLTWQKLLVRTESDAIQVSDEQIDEVLDRIRSSEGQSEYQVVELLLLANERAGISKADVRALAVRLIDQVRGGTSFGNIAIQFSDSPSASRGGDLGWLLAAEMPPAMASVVPGLALGRVSDPIEEDRGYRVYGLVDRRLANTTTDENTEIAVRLYVLPLAPNASEATIRAKIEEAGQIRASIDSCEEFRRRAAAAGTPQPPSPTRLRLGDMNPNIRGVIAGLAKGQISEPLPSTVGIQLIIVCDREVVSNLPSRSEIQESLALEKLQTVSERRLRNLRRAAFIEIRG
ncbi:MAG: peptidylprolyl isomerase [Alphaproteobacteria bacterium]|nr:peptidylprolyl isomerase [Alphaproteobacteria bacterium]